MFSRAGVVAGAGLVAVLAGCGGEVSVPVSQQTAHRGAVLFEERCSGCHSLEAANAYGSKPEGQKTGGERTNGPNFNVRREKEADVLYAIRNGGFSGAIMPANIVVGQDAKDVAQFVSQYSGADRKKGLEEVNPSPNTGSGTRSGQ
jgi:mono/diheme cytochrome c family protein